MNKNKKETPKIRIWRLIMDEKTNAANWALDKLSGRFQYTNQIESKFMDEKRPRGIYLMVIKDTKKRYLVYQPDSFIEPFLWMGEELFREWMQEHLNYGRRDE